MVAHAYTKNIVGLRLSPNYLHLPPSYFQETSAPIVDWTEETVKALVDQLADGTEIPLS